MITDLDKRIMNLLKSKAVDGLITFKTEHVVETLKLEKRTVQRHLKKLVDDGKLELVETGKRHGGNTVRILEWDVNPLFACDVSDCSTEQPHKHVIDLEHHRCVRQVRSDGKIICHFPGCGRSFSKDEPEEVYTEPQGSRVELLDPGLVRFLERLDATKEGPAGVYVIVRGYTRQFACNHRQEAGICSPYRVLILRDKHWDVIRPLPLCKHEVCQVHASGECQEPEADYPKCVKHHSPMRQGRHGDGSWYCPRKMVDGSWCDYKRQP